MLLFSAEIINFLKARFRDGVFWGWAFVVFV